MESTSIPNTNIPSSTVDAFVLACWHNIKGSTVLRVWRGERGVDVKDSQIIFVSRFTLVDELPRETAVNVETKMNILSELGIVVISAVFSAQFQGYETKYLLSVILKKTMVKRLTQLYNIIDFRLKLTTSILQKLLTNYNIEDAIDSFSEYLADFAYFVQGIFQAVLPSNPTIETVLSKRRLDPRNREFLSRAITAHLKTHGYSVIIGDNLGKLNSWIYTMAMFLHPRERKICREACPYFLPEVHVQGILATNDDASTSSPGIYSHISDSSKSHSHSETYSPNNNQNHNQNSNYNNNNNNNNNQNNNNTQNTNYFNTNHYNHYNHYYNGSNIHPYNDSSSFNSNSNQTPNYNAWEFDSSPSSFFSANSTETSNSYPYSHHSQHQHQHHSQQFSSHLPSDGDKIGSDQSISLSSSGGGIGAEGRSKQSVEKLVPDYDVFFGRYPMTIIDIQNDQHIVYRGSLFSDFINKRNKFINLMLNPQESGDWNGTTPLFTEAKEVAPSVHRLIDMLCDSPIHVRKGLIANWMRNLNRRALVLIQYLESRDLLPPIMPNPASFDQEQSREYVLSETVLNEMRQDLGLEDQNELQIVLAAAEKMKPGCYGIIDPSSVFDEMVLELFEQLFD